MNPYKAFVLTPSFVVREVTIVATSTDDYVTDDKGKRHHFRRVYRDVTHAIKDGRLRVKQAREAIKKRKKETDLQARNLTKAEEQIWLANTK